MKKSVYQRLSETLNEKGKFTKQDAKRFKLNWKNVVRRASEYNIKSHTMNLSVRAVFNEDVNGYVLMGKNKAHAKKLLIY